MKAALIRNFVGAGFGKGALLLFRIAQVPLLLAGLGVDEFGRWVVLASLPAWLSVANLGFASVAANEMSLAAAVNDHERARSFYSTAFVLLTGLSLLVLAAVAVAAPLIPWERLVRTAASRHDELALAAALLAGGLLIAFHVDLFAARFRAARKAHFELVTAGLRPWPELLAQVAVLRVSHRFDALAAATVGATLLTAITVAWLSRRAAPEITAGTRWVDRSLFRQLLPKGLAFQAFPLGNALMFQGNVLVVQAVLGPAAVATFATARTLVRAVTQFMELINQVIWPELTFLLGARKLPEAARLHRAGVGLSVTVALVMTTALAVGGTWIYSLWTGTAIQLNRQVLMLFLLPIPFNALWYTSSVVHAACNRHEGLAIRYLIGCAMALAACAILASTYGLPGAAASTLAGDLVLVPYVIRRSLALTGDSWAGFSRGLFTEIRSIASLVSRGRPAAPSSPL